MKVRTGVPHILVIDPATHTPEVECFNRLALTSPLPCTYHLPAMFGLQSLEAEDMSLARGLVILGSAASVHDRVPWQETFESWLRPQLEKRIPTLAICYGHQMLAHMYGGKVDFVFPDQGKHSGFREIKVEATPCWPASKGQIVVSHCETVVEAPRDMHVFAASPEISIDGLAHKTLPIWSFQSHPEAVPEFLRNHAIPLGSMEALRYGQDLVAGFLNFAAKTAS